MADDNPVPAALGDLDGFERLRDGADLVRFDEHGVGYVICDGPAKTLWVGNNVIVGDELHFPAERLSMGLPSVVVVLAYPILDRDYRIL